MCAGRVLLMWAELLHLEVSVFCFEAFRFLVADSFVLRVLKLIQVFELFFIKTLLRGRTLQ